MYALLLATYLCSPAQTVNGETTFKCVFAYERQIDGLDEERCGSAAGAWKRGARPDLLLMRTADCLQVSDPKKK